MADVFISYKREERKAVEIIAEKLRALKLDIWFDEKLRSGNSFDDQIAHEIEAAKAVLTCWTPAAIESEWVRSEAAMAREANKFIACLLAPTTLIPPFNLVQTDNLTTWAGQENDPAWLKILSRIGELVGRPGLALYYAVMRPDASALELRAWVNENGDDPMVDTVWARIAQLEGESSSERVVREKAEARERDRKRKTDAVRSKELARERGLRDPGATQRRIRLLTYVVIAIFVATSAFGIYTLDSKRRQHQLDRADTPAAVRAFISANRWHPIARAGREKLAGLDQAGWQAAQSHGTLDDYNRYIEQFSADGAFINRARTKRAEAENVLKAQTMLSRLQYYTGPLNGALDSATISAIDAFQYKQGAVQTDSVDANLLERLQVAIQGWTHVSPDQLIAQRVGPPTEEEYRAIARRLKIDGPTLMAVRDVEIPTAGFDRNGRPLILFERHIFSRKTERRFDLSHPKISNPVPGGYGPAGAYQWERLKEAYALDPDAAYEATSWGRTQLMGFQYRIVGFQTVAEFVRFMSRSEANQLEVWARFMDSHKFDALQRHDWAAFAHQYNGPHYATYGYDRRLADAYMRATAEFAGSPKSAVPAAGTQVSQGNSAKL
jgi:peptidoglycan hydrolase-like protein with peptidoglycan-binding domain